MIHSSPALILASGDDEQAVRVLCSLDRELEATEPLLPFVGRLLWQGSGFQGCPSDAGPSEADLRTAVERLLAGGEAYRQAEEAGLELRVGRVAVWSVATVQYPADLQRLQEPMDHLRRIAQEMRWQLDPVVAVLMVPPSFDIDEGLQQALADVVRCAGFDSVFVASQQTETGQWMPASAWEQQVAALLSGLLAADLFGPDQAHRALLSGNGSAPNYTAVGLKRLLNPRRQLADFCAASLSVSFLTRLLSAEAGSHSQAAQLDELEVVLGRYQMGARPRVDEAVDPLAASIRDWFKPEHIRASAGFEQPTVLNRLSDRVQDTEKERVERDIDAALVQEAERCGRDLRQALLAATRNDLASLALIELLIDELERRLQRQRVLEAIQKPSWKFPTMPGERLRAIRDRRCELYGGTVWLVLWAVVLQQVGSHFAVPADWITFLHSAWPGLEPIVTHWRTLAGLVTGLGILPLLTYYGLRMINGRRDERRLLADCRQTWIDYVDDYKNWAVSRFVDRQREELTRLRRQIAERRVEWNSLRSHLSVQAKAARNGGGTYAWEHVLVGPDTFDDEASRLCQMLSPADLLSEVIERLPGDSPTLLAAQPGDLSKALWGVTSSLALQTIQTPDLATLLEREPLHLRRWLQEMERDGAPALSRQRRTTSGHPHLSSIFLTPDTTLSLARLAAAAGHELRACALDSAVSLLTFRRGNPLTPNAYRRTGRP